MRNWARTEEKCGCISPVASVSLIPPEKSLFTVLCQRIFILNRFHLAQFINLPFVCTMNIVGLSGLVLYISRFVISPDLASQLQSLSHCHDVASHFS